MMGLHTPIRILVAHADAPLRASISVVLRDCGYSVDTLSIDEAVMPLLDTQPFDVLCCDLSPFNAQTSLVEVARRRYPQLTILVITNQTSAEFAQQAMRAGAHDCLALPSLAHTLPAVIERHLERMRLGLAMHAEHTEHLLFQTVQALTTAIEAKDPYTAGHSQKVARLAAHFGLVLRLSPADLFVLRLGGLLHDIGKIGIPESILLKPGPLSTHEWEIMKQHPAIGASIVGQIAGLARVAEVVTAHHERWDGHGYPRGTAREAIPLLARLLYIVDAYDAMTSNRAYRNAVRHEDAIAVIRRQAGSQFDHDLVNIFIEDVLPSFAHSDLAHTEDCFSASAGVGFPG